MTLKKLPYPIVVRLFKNSRLFPQASLPLLVAFKKCYIILVNRRYDIKVSPNPKMA